jgi:beta-glucosidase
MGSRHTRHRPVSDEPAQSAGAGSARRRRGRNVVAALAGAALITGSTVGVAHADTAFATQQSGTYAGLPLFDGVPAHLDEYLDTLMTYAGLEAAVNWTNGRRGDFTIPTGPNAGHVVPGAPQWGEGVQGISTDFPAITSQGQTWNTDLVQSIGGVVGDEKLYTQSWSSSLSAYNATLAAAMQDLRPNPLSGRIDESYGEDEELASDFITAFATGASGVTDPNNEDGFWSKAVVVAKHYTDYAAQWYRIPGSTDASQRALMEYWAQPPLDALGSGAISGMITSYGRTNGVPNAVSPLIQYAESKSPWGSVYTTPDNGAENRLHVDGAYSNGFDVRYTPTWGDATALMAVAGQGSIAATGGSADRNTELLRAIENGTYGITADDVYELAKLQVAPLVRVGLFNERDEQGVPKFYPWSDHSSASATALDYTNAAHQDVALRAAQEGIVLLKNDDGVLPLDRSDSLAVAGPLSDARFRTTYSTSTPSLADAGLTPKEGIETLSTGDVTSDSDGNVIRLKSVSAGKYLTLGNEASPSLAATQADGALAANFERFDWGQGAVGLRSIDNGKWLQYASNQVNVGQTFNLNGRNNGSGSRVPTMPYQIRPVDNGDGTVSFIVSSYSASFGGGFETTYYSAGRYLTVDPTTGQVGVSAVLGNADNARALLTDDAKFAVDTVAAAGSHAVVADKDYAIVVVGQPSRNSQGEGSDRSTLALGADQYELVNTVADAYPGRTIVVLSTSAPVLAEQIQNNDNVAAVVEAPDGGQYGFYALAQVLFGDYAPTGRLTQTWYSSMDALPTLTAHSIPQGPDATTTLAGLDPRFVVDMTNADPAEAKLTYKYSDADTTYDFGYGLSYSSFEYGDLNVEENDGHFTASVDVHNTGDVDTSEVVQVYASNGSTSYGTATPAKQLVGFEKVRIAAGATENVTVAFDSSALALWDVNANTDVVESGEYTFGVGASSSDVRDTASLQVVGSQLAGLDTRQPVNVFDHSFDSSNVYYREASKANTAHGLREDTLVGGYYAVGAREDGAWVALNDVDLSGLESIVLTLGSSNDEVSAVEVRVDSPTGRVLSRHEISATGSDQYVIGATVSTSGDIPVRELAYAEVPAAVTGEIGGVHDLYLVFSGVGAQVRDIQTVRADQPIVQPELTLNPLQGKAGDQIVVTGTGFTEGAEVTLSFGAAASSSSTARASAAAIAADSIIGRGVADSDGMVQVGVTVPDVGAGEYVVTASVDDDVLASASFTVLASPDDSGSGGVDTGTGTDPEGGSLAVTGGQIAAGALIAAGILLAAGTVILAIRRRRAAHI